MSASPNPSAAYAAGVARGEWQDDAAQRPALRELDRLHEALRAPVANGGLLSRLFGNDAPPAPRGLYLWGGVGRGKTFLIDLFYDGLPIAERRRTHFHRFMREVHERLRAHAGERDPLAAIAKEWRASLRVLVLDEFFVSDIGDAMLLARLLDRMFAEGVVLVTSSNAAPAELYKDGLQRARFLPAIKLIEEHCVTVFLDSPQDYRLRALTQSPVYRAPLDAQSDAWLHERWDTLSHACPREDDPFVVDGRTIASRGRAEGMGWFDFAALCEGPRGTSD